ALSQPSVWGTGQPDPDCVRLCEETIERLGDEPRLRATVIWRWTMTLFNGGEASAALQVAERHATPLLDSDDPDVVLPALGALFWSHVSVTTDLAQITAVADRYRPLAQHGDDAVRGPAIDFLCDIAMYRGDRRELEALARDGQAIAERRR